MAVLIISVVGTWAYFSIHKAFIVEKRTKLQFIEGFIDKAGATKLITSVYRLHDVVITGYDPAHCRGDDTYATGFVAKTQENEIVSGVVCLSWSGEQTTRFLRMDVSKQEGTKSD